MSTASRHRQWQPALVCALLLLATLATYWPAHHFDFINYDDQEYVYENASVQGGLNWPAVRWAFTTSHASNWHPLTWFSHMLDWQIYGRRAGGHHVTNVLFHCLNSLVLFGLCRRLMGRLWPSAMVAALFALHPLHVESVAWVSERKDVLSTCFGLLALSAYVAYAQAARGSTPDAPRTTPSSILHPPSSFFYVLSLLLFACSLMSKPMLVTLPFLLLLLDYWPLARLQLTTQHSKLKTLLPLLIEKLPFFALALASSLLTFLIQRQSGAMRSLTEVPFSLRLANGVVSCAVYLRKMLWPSDLAVFYPYPVTLPAWRVAGAVLLIAAVSGVVFSQIRRRPWLAFGWCWYLGTLVPVLGLVQVGTMAAADRYTYIPLVGVFIMLVWSGSELATHRPAAQRLLLPLSLLVLAACAAWSVPQVRFWADSKTLFQHALKVTRGNSVAHNSLGTVLAGEKKFAEAERHYREALRLRPKFPEAESNLGSVLASQGRLEEAFTHCRQATLLRSDYAPAYRNLGLLYGKQGDWAQASQHLARAIELGWQPAIAYATLSQTLAMEGKPGDATAAAQTAVKLDPSLPEAQYQLGCLLANTPRAATAIPHLEAAARLRPDWTPPLTQLAWLLATAPDAAMRNGARSVELAERAVALTPQLDPQVLSTLAAAYAEAGRYQEALQTAEQAIQLATTNQPGLARAIGRHIQRYRANQPFHRPPPPPGR